MIKYHALELHRSEGVKKTYTHEAKIYCDGASSGNPGHAGIGVVIHYKRVHSLQFTVHRVSEYIGITTNNVAEYSALIRGLEEAKALGLRKIEIFVDSELLVKQIKGLYKVKSASLKPLWKKIQDMLKQFDNCVINHIKRELNKEADLLSKKAIKNKDLINHIEHRGTEETQN